MIQIFDQYREWKQWEAPEFGITRPHDADYFTLEIGPYLQGKPMLRILELGFGNGALLSWLKGQGYMVSGVEIDDELNLRASALGVAAFSSLAQALEQLGEGSQDVIVALDVLEHVEPSQLISLVSDCSRLLKSRGLMMARFPNADSPYGRVFQHADITHKNSIGFYMVSQLAGMCGFKILYYNGAARPHYRLSLRRRTKYLAARIVQWIAAMPLRYLHFEDVPIPMEPNVFTVLEKK
jgi:2-polyprenyl-3-methyl-5-hydroxy-6-metoxy-1,4-benzoquinol methylase